MSNNLDAETFLEEEPGGPSYETVNYHNKTLDVGREYYDPKEFINNIEDLSRYLPLDKEQICRLKKVSDAYHLKIPFYYFSLIENTSDNCDPIGKQCIPNFDELSQGSFESKDPLAEEKSSPLDCLVHRYPDRALLLVTNRCFMYCRHCTRKRIWSKKINEPTLEDIDRALNYVGRNPKIREIIVSGGDPLTLPTERLEAILSKIHSFSNIEVVRIGTRTPVVFPRRIDDRLCEMLKKYDNVWVNVQFNHPREITPQAALACRKLQKIGIPVSNQSVLLKGVNDNLQVMRDLCQRLQAIRVRPYYLFQCDPVSGTSHFRTSPWQGREIIKKMQGFTSGMCVPTFVIDAIGGKGKIPFGPDYLVSDSDRGMILKNYKDEIFFYQDTPVQPEAITNSKKVRSVNTIGITFNLKNKDAGENHEEYDEIETIESIKKEIEKYGFKVVIFEQDDNFLKRLLSQRPDFVFNIAEGRGDKRGRESQVPAILESLDIPYSGSDPVALGITLDKYLTNRLLKSANILVPEMAMIKDVKDLENLGNIFGGNGSFLVKPRWEGSSKGIFLNSLVSNFDDLKKRVEEIISKYEQPALIEEFLERDEITVGVYGNEVPQILGMMKIVPRDKACKNFLYSLEIKQDWQNKVKYEPQESILKNIQKIIEFYAIKAYKELELKDMARIDFRLDTQNKPKIIDINPLPGLSSSYGDLPILYKLKGNSYNSLIRLILQDSFNRYGFSFDR
ncbi:MAG: KamA family radical SAM protein [Candidatus Omnitrophica bacterium]|nr:KamA family radical SAM protein [Candidatus Omnitrophota bacterium]